MAIMDARIPLMVEQFKLPDFAGIQRQQEQDEQGRNLYQEKMKALQSTGRTAARTESEAERVAAEDAAHNAAVQRHTSKDPAGNPIIDKPGVIRDLASSGYGRRASMLNEAYTKELAEKEKELLLGRKATADEERARAATKSSEAAAARAEAAGRSADAAYLRAEKYQAKAASDASSVARDRLNWDKEKAAEKEKKGGDASQPVSGIKVDRQGNRLLDPIVARQLSASQKAVGNADTAVSQIDELIRDVLPKASQSGAGSVVGSVQQFVGTGDIGAANKRLENFANFALGIIESPLMKGAPSERDATRALSVINDPSAPLDVKTKALENLKSMLQEELDRHDQAISLYDDETQKKLRAIGVGQSVKRDSSAKPAVTVEKAAVDAFAKANGMTYEAALKQIEKEGFKVK
jgi:hypothetical protein